ncbi:PhnD/SsuA/transferrin family substrate-binding protein, partial [Klebsiella variicola]|uniref:PhnD/SsuA/transferrin family substrate-binding protein n=1 Tax=Klebsiella variicola TaxID=244366 RepID=UPI00272F843B
GYYVFAKNNVDAATAFKRTLNSSHEVNALSVAKGQLDVATFNTESWDRLEVTQPDKAAMLKVFVFISQMKINLTNAYAGS